VVDAPHPDTAAPIVGTNVPGSREMNDMARTTSQVLPTSWDITPTADGPV
jgi:hypothetical protein